LLPGFVADLTFAKVVVLICFALVLSNTQRKGTIQMMDHERTEKELQEIFEEIQHSYKTLVDNALTFENSAEKTHGTQARLEEMANQSRTQRQEFERLVRKSNEAYTKILKAPTDEHHHKVAEAKADLEEASSS
jgi:Skp family chaperone for outer membrane proteins